MPKLANFYSQNAQIYPNYLALDKESNFLFKNIHKK